MGRTNLEIDDELVAKAMRRYGPNTKRAVVDLALHRLVGDAMSGKEALGMGGSGWEGNLSRLRMQSEDPIG